MSNFDNNPEESCGTCRFFLNPKNTPFGRCHRYPLQVVEDRTPRSADESGNARWPRVRESGWCGEWKYVGSLETPELDALKEWAES